MNISHVFIYILAIEISLCYQETHVPVQPPQDNTDLDMHQYEDPAVHKSQNRHPKLQVARNLDPTGSIDDMKDQMKFFNDFACMMLTQKHLAIHENKIITMDDRLKAKKAFQKVISNYFKTCKENMTPEAEMAIMTGKAPPGFQMLDLDVLSEHSVDYYINHQDLEVNDEDLKNIAAFEKIHHEVNQLKQEYHEEREGSDLVIETDDGGNREETKVKTQEIKQDLWSYIAGYVSIEGLSIIIPFVLIIGVLMYNLLVKMVNKTIKPSSGPISSDKNKKKKAKKHI